MVLKNIRFFVPVASIGCDGLLTESEMILQLITKKFQLQVIFSNAVIFLNEPHQRWTKKHKEK